MTEPAAAPEGEARATAFWESVHAASPRAISPMRRMRCA